VAAQVSLAGASAVTAALVLLRCHAGETTMMTASACAALLVAACGLGAVLWPLPSASVGTLLILSALTGLAAAPRLSVVLAGLTPGTAASAPIEDGDRRAATGHRILAGLVLGFSAAAAGGAVAVGWAAVAGHLSWVAASGFCAAVGVAVLLRARVFAAGRCRYSLLLSGFLCTTTSLAIATSAMVQYAHWIGAALVCAGVAALVRDGHPSPSPVKSRAVDVVEYVVLAAVPPLACAVLDLFGLVRGMGIG
jgi:type VII secretion integral membrane protein EccD